LNVDLHMLRKEIEELTERLSVLHQQEIKAIKEVSLKCEHCNYTQKIGSTPILQYCGYVKPHGCTNGDYYKAHAELYFLCPECGDLNIIDSQYPEYELLSHSENLLKYYSKKFSTKAIKSELSAYLAGTPNNLRETKELTI
jgi:Zn finger protein HypA/HybF involved in hydrogenase expression